MSRHARPPRRVRNIRVEDELWEAALDAAGERGDVLSEQIRRFLARYVANARKEDMTRGARG